MRINKAGLKRLEKLCVLSFIAMIMVAVIEARGWWPQGPAHQPAALAEVHLQSHVAGALLTCITGLVVAGLLLIAGASVIRPAQAVRPSRQGWAVRCLVEASFFLSSAAMIVLVSSLSMALVSFAAGNSGQVGLWSSTLVVTKPQLVVALAAGMVIWDVCAVSTVGWRLRGWPWNVATLICLGLLLREPSLAATLWAGMIAIWLGSSPEVAAIAGLDLAADDLPA